MRNRFATVPMAAALTAALASLGAPAARAGFPGANGRIAFESDRTGNYEIWTMNGDGTDAAVMAGFRSAADRSPAWSPDGSRLAFQSNRTGDIEIWVVNADGSDLRQLTFAAGPDIQPAWSPDGARLAFARSAGGEFDIFTMRASDGGDVINVTLAPGNDTLPAWSPDGSLLAYRGERDGNGEIYVQPAHSAGPAAAANLTNHPSDDDHAAWSPDGGSIAFASDRDGDGPILYTMFADGSVPQAAPGTMPGDTGPAWSPDGAVLAHARITDGGFTEIKVSALQDGSGSILAPGFATSASPDWQPLPPSGENRPPVANAGPDGAVRCASAEGGTVTLDGRASSDPDSTAGTNDGIAIYEWFLDFGLSGERLLASGAVAEVLLPAGSHIVTLRVTDAAGLTDTDEATWTVADSRPATIEVGASPAVLWPPNHRMVAIRASVAVTGGTCGAAPGFVLVSVVSDEADDALGAGDGATTGDIAGADVGTADLDFAVRAERAAGRAGRTYTVTYAVAGGEADGASASATIFVPHAPDRDDPARSPKPGRRGQRERSR